MHPLSLDSSINAFASSPFGWLTMTAIFMILALVIPPTIIVLFWRQFLDRVERRGVVVFTAIFLGAEVGAVALAASLPHLLGRTPLVSLLQAISFVLIGATILAAALVDALALCERYTPLITPLRRRFPHRETFQDIPRDQVHKRFEPTPEVDATVHIRRDPPTNVEFLDVTTGPTEIPIWIDPVPASRSVPPQEPLLFARPGRHAAPLPAR